MITGVNKETTDEEEETIDWIKIPLQRFYVKMVTEQRNCTILGVDEWLSLVIKKLEIIQTCMVMTQPTLVIIQIYYQKLD